MRVKMYAKLMTNRVNKKTPKFFRVFYKLFAKELRDNEKIGLR
jgi:hypothetical protein